MIFPIAFAVLVAALMAVERRSRPRRTPQDDHWRNNRPPS